MINNTHLSCHEKIENISNVNTDISEGRNTEQ